MQVGTYPTRNFATLGPLLLRPPFTGASVQSFELPLTPSFYLPAPGRRQCLYVVLTDFADTCVFNKQSLGPILRGSLEHLRLLASPTCVRLRYGRPSTSHARLFSAAWLRTLCREQFPFGIGARLKESFLPPHRLPPYIGYSTTRRSCHFRVPPHGQTLLERYRNIDLFPIAYALRPRLRDRLTRSG